MKPKKAKNRATKTFLEFDEKARKEYLTGFQKRKQERKKQFEEKLLKKLKEEQNELKKHRRSYGKQAAVPHTNLMSVSGEMSSPRTLDLPSHTVTTTDISTIDYSSQLYLGQNTQHMERPVEEAPPAAMSISRRKYQKKMEEVRILEMKVAALSGQKKKKKKKNKKPKGRVGKAQRRK